MKIILFVAAICCLIGSIVCPPVKPSKDKEGPPRNEEMTLGLQYEKYLKEVVNVLEEDEEFKKRLEESNITEIKSGDIAKHLEFVSHKVRSKLDELKRKEVDRLNQLKKLLDHQRNLNDPKGFKPKMPGLGRAIPDISGKVVDAMLKAQGINDPNAAKDHDHHVDMQNPESFEVDDLKKLIVKATKDLENIDKVRKGEFKKYELEKEHLRREKLKQMSERERKEEEAKFAELKKKHKDHPKVHHPGNKAQLEEVWEETDGMKKEDFNPKTFFFLHDTNGDGYLDEEELESLFQKELDKVYDPKNAEDDMVERYEEMNRMREHVQDEVDKDEDGLVSLQEFLDSTHKEAFDKDPEWKTVDEDDEWTEEELKEYEEELKRQNERIQQLNDGHAQAGEVNVQDNNLRFQQGQDHQQQGQGGQPVQQMHQQPGFQRDFDRQQQVNYQPGGGAPAYRQPMRPGVDMPPRQIKMPHSNDRFAGAPDQQAQHQPQEAHHQAQENAQQQVHQQAQEHVQQQAVHHQDQQGDHQAQQQAAQQQAAQQAAQEQAAQQAAQQQAAEQAAQQQAAQQAAQQQAAQQQAAQQAAQQQAAQQQAAQQAAQQQAQQQPSEQQAQQQAAHQQPQVQPQH